MFFTYLRKELFGRKKQTAIIAIGVSLALTLVILISSITNGIKISQSEALEAVYGVGTDMTVSQAATKPTEGEGNGQEFAFGAEEGTTATDGTDSTEISQSTLSLNRGTTAIAESTLATVKSIDNVKNATAILLLNNNSFSGQMPTRSDSTAGETREAPVQGETTSESAPSGGPDGAGGSSFNVDQFSVAGISNDVTAGPMSSVTFDSGAFFTATQDDANVAVLDSDYATSADLAVDGIISIGGTDFTIVGIVSSTSSDSETAANVYIPLKVAQTLSTQEGMISSIYVTAASSSNIDQIQADITKALPELQVNTQESLASTVNSSLTSVSDSFNVFGFWISMIALGAAFLLSILFTLSGIARRTRELGTLKSIGWKNSRIVAQITGESLVQSLMGGILGIVLGLTSIYILNLISPTISAAADTQERGLGMGEQVAAAQDVVLQAVLTPETLIYALVIAIVGGLIAGLSGALKVTKLQPAEALRSI